MLTGQLDTTGRLLTQIPRLEGVIRIIYAQGASKNSAPVRSRDPEALGAHILHVCLDFDALLMRGFSRKEAFRQLVDHEADYNPDVVQALASARLDDAKLQRRNVLIDQLKDGMIVDEEVRTAKGVLLVPRGYTVNETVRQRLRNFRLQDEIDGSIVVLDPQAEAEPAKQP